MDKPLPKIGGITIERVPKTTPTKNAIPAQQRTIGANATTSFPAAINFSSSISMPNQDFEEDFFGEDETGEMNEAVEDGGWHESGNNEYLGKPQEKSLLSSEEEHQDEEEDDINEEETLNKLSENETAVSQSLPILPPGVVFEKKITTSSSGPIKKNVYLPPGISFDKKKNDITLPLTGVPRIPSTAPRPARGTLRQVRPPRNVAAYLPGNSAMANRPTARASPMRAVRPRTNLPQRMMINDFLEQKMQVGSSSVGLRASNPPRLPFKSNVYPLPRSRPPVSPKRPVPGIQLPPGISMKPRLVDVPSEGSEESDPDDKVPLIPQNVQRPLPKIPPGINFERKKVEKVEMIKPLVKMDAEKVKVPANIRLPLGVSIERSKPTLPIQVPAGISIEKRRPSQPEPQQIEKSASLEENELEEEEEDFDETEELPNDAGDHGDNGYFPEEMSSSNHPEQPNSDEFPEQEPDEFDQLEGEENEEGEEEEMSPKLENPVGFQLPPGISLGKQTFGPPDDSGGVFNNTDELLREGMEEEESEECEPSLDKSGESDPTTEENPEGAEESEEPESFDKEMIEDDAEETATEVPMAETEPEDVAGSSFEPEFDEEGEGNESEEMKLGEIDFESLIAAPTIATNKQLQSDSQLDEIDDKMKVDEMQNLVDMMTKGEIEGEIEDDKDDEEEEKKVEKRKAEDGADEDEDGASLKKKVKSEDDDGEEEADDESIDKTKVSSSHLRKNIREVMDETKLDETTLAAQRQEAERLKRLQEQQRILREVKRQIAINKSAQKAQNQSQVLSLLKGNSETSILKKSGITIASSSSSSKVPNHVLLKMSNGQQTSLSDKMREMLKFPGRSVVNEPAAKSLLRQGMLSSSVSIAPIKREPVDEEDKKKKRGDVVTLSSDSDDDCIVLSDEEIESEPDEDPTNSGMHTSDRYNVPDEQGRVLVNTGHRPEEADVFLAPQIARVIKPHQIGGVRFLYDNIIESTDRYDSSAGFGCILAHSMGLGKTLQIVSFSDIFLRHTSGKKILCIMPINTIQNWQAEYNMWLPKENAQKTTDDVRCREFDIFIVNESSKNIHSRGKVILDWHRSGGVLLMGYELFRQLSLRKPIKSKRKRPDDTEDERNRELVEQIYCALVKPGPDLVICDEGHRIKNSHATTSQALKQIRTRRRVVLTGYPLQNNLLEYWCMVDFVRPNYLGSKTEFSNMFERPIQNGQCIDSTPQDKRLMRFRAHVLHSLLEGFVQRRSHAVLQQVLPQKEEYVLLLRFTPFQRKLYDTFMNDVVRTVAVPNPLKAFAVCCKIWNHPDVLYNFLKKKGEQRDLDLEEPLPPAGSSIPPRFPLDVPSSSYPVNVPWPKKGPGSRGGKVRQRRGVGPNVVQSSSTPQPDKPSERPIPNRFPIQNQTTGQRTNQSDPFTSNSQSSFQQGNFFNPQQQQQTSSHQFQQQNDNFPFHGPNFEESEQQQMFGNNQKLFNNDMFSNNQKMFPNDPKFKNNDFGANFGSDINSSNFYRNQDQFPQQNSSSFGNSSINSQQQFYQQNDNMSTTSNFDYSQSTTDLAPDFSQMSNYSEPGFESSNFNSNQNDFQQQQQNFWGNNWPSTSQASQGGYSGGSSGDEFMSPSKFSNFEEKKDFEKGNCDFGASFSGTKPDPMKNEGSHPNATKSSTIILGGKTEDDKKEDVKIEPKKEDIPYEWATELLKNYVTGVVENSSKMEVFFLILTQSLLRGDRILVFSQSLLTLDLIEDYLQRRYVPGKEEAWAKNRSYFRLDGSTPALEREKLINEFNINNQVHVFLVSTRAGSLGINLVGANRVVVFDASWNPCHDTQAVCRVYRYGQKKPCYVYRLVMDCCLEKKIYDRQINKQGMADRVVDELNPDAHLSIKEVTNLCWDDQEETSVKDFSELQDKYHDDIVKLMLAKHSSLLSKAPFQHESLLIDRKEKKLSQAEKRLAKRSYELEKQATTQPRSMYQLFPSSSGMRSLPKPIASVKPMQNERYGGMPSRSKWIPSEVWHKQGMSAQEMTLPLDVVIPTNSPDRTSIVLKAGQRVMVLKSPKGIYMQLETGKIIAIRTNMKVGPTADKPEEKKANPIATALKNNPNVTITSTNSARGKQPTFYKTSSLDKKAAAVNMAATKGRIAVNNKNRPLPSVTKKPFGGDVPFQLKKQFVLGKDEKLVPDSAVSRLLNRNTPGSSSDMNSSRDAKVGFDESTDMSQEIPHVPDLSQIPDFPEDLVPPVDSQMNSKPTAMTSDLVPASASGSQPTPSWTDTSEQDLSRDIAKESLDSLSSMAMAAKDVPSSEASETQFPASSADAATGATVKEVKKEADASAPWPPKQTYPMDPYGSYYPGYPPGYYPPMPGYEGYPYPRGYPPPPQVPIKTEAQDGTPPPAPAPAAAPPLYPPYPNPYPYYNYPPYPPQGTPPVPAPAGVPVKTEATETSTYPPPYTPRPPYPAPTPAPGFYPNYPPFRPFHDPNYPYPNYSPYMPPHPPGYGYPMQGPHHVHQATDSAQTAPDPSSTNNSLTQ